MNELDIKELQIKVEALENTIEIILEYIHIAAESSNDKRLKGIWADLNGIRGFRDKQMTDIEEARREKSKSAN